MRSLNKNPKSNNRKNAAKAQKSTKSTDVDSKVLQQMVGKMGNDNLKTEMSKGAHQRDAVLALIVERLQEIQKVQNIELDELHQKPDWFRNVAKGENGFFIPDPTRWHECAKLFKQAAQALCQGNVSKGTQLLEQALNQEESAYDSLPVQVTNRLQSDQKSGADQDANIGESIGLCPSRNMPSEIKVADEILNVQESLTRVSSIRKTRPFTWWEDLNEEQDENETDDNAVDESTKEEQEEKIEHSEEEHLQEQTQSQENLREPK